VKSCKCQFWGSTPFGIDITKVQFEPVIVLAEMIPVPAAAARNINTVAALMYEG
jgi:hypothetical protein